MRRLLVPTFLLGFCIGSPALAATLDQIQGPVSINRGDKFQPVRKPIEASTGDLISAGRNGRARLTYDDGCVVHIKPNTVLRVSIPSPCKAGYLFPGQLAPFGIGAAATFAAFCISACGDDDSNGPRPASP